MVYRVMERAMEVYGVCDNRGNSTWSSESAGCKGQKGTIHGPTSGTVH